MKKSLLIFTLTLSACTPTLPAINTSDEFSSSASSSAALVVHTTPAIVVTTSSTPAKKDYKDYTDDDWKNALTPAQYHILREAGTERPFTSSLLDEHRAGTFVSADCGIALFRSEQKYDSGTGWPSFWAPISSDLLTLEEDGSRVEVRSPCGGHLGHVFKDGPEPTGKRYCMNGLALKFIPDEGE